MGNKYILFTSKNPPLTERGIFYLWLLVFVFAAILEGFSQPRLEVKDAKRNFGFASRGEVLINKYVISNKGNAPLVISNAEVACSCTRVEFSKKPVLPGGSDTITVSFNTASVYGRQDRTVQVFSNDPAGPATLRFKAIVKNK